MVVDASDAALGVVLFQVVDGIEHPTCYLSRKLMQSERFTKGRSCLTNLLGFLEEVHEKLDADRIVGVVLEFWKINSQTCT